MPSRSPATRSPAWKFVHDRSAPVCARSDRVRRQVRSRHGRHPGHRRGHRAAPCCRRRDRGRQATLALKHRNASQRSAHVARHALPAMMSTVSSGPGNRQETLTMAAERAHRLASPQGLRFMPLPRSWRRWRRHPEARWVGQIDRTLADEALPPEIAGATVDLHQTPVLRNHEVVLQAGNPAIAEPFAQRVVALARRREHLDDDT